MDGQEYADKITFYALRIRAQARAGRYAAIKAYVARVGGGQRLSGTRLREIAQGPL